MAGREGSGGRKGSVRRRAQSPVEYSALIIIVLGALLAGGNYFKRGLQGRWRAAIDDVGDQYDPRVMNTNVTYSMEGESQVLIRTVPNAAGDGYWTMRNDISRVNEYKTGTTRAGGY